MVKRNHKTVRLKGTECPGCGEHLDGATLLWVSDPKREEKFKPRVGDYSVCLVCGQPLRFSTGLKLKPISTKRVARLRRTDPDIAKVMSETIIRINQRIQEECDREAKEQGLKWNT